MSTNNYKEYQEVQRVPRSTISTKKYNWVVISTIYKEVQISANK